MNNDKKIKVSAAIIAISLFFLVFVVPYKSVFIVSYIFALAAIAGDAISLLALGKYKTTKAPYGYAYLHTSGVYTGISILFSVIACAVPFSAILTFVIHLILLAVFVVRAISLTSASEYIEKIEEKTVEKHNEFLREKEGYWK